MNPNSSESLDFEHIPISRQKAEKVARSFDFYGYQPFSAEQIEKVREPVRKTLTTLGASAIAAPSNLLNFATGLFSSNASKYIPKTQDLMKNIEKWTGESLEPSNFWEEYAMNIAGGVGSFLGLGGGRSLAGTLATPIAAETAKQTLKYGGAPEWMQTAGALITSVLSGTRGAPNPTEAARQFHRTAENLIPSGAMINAQGLASSLQKMITRLERGGTNPETAPVLNKAREILQRINQGNGQIDPRDVFAFRTAVNAIRGDPQTLQGGRRFLDGLNRMLNRQLRQYGKTQNPQFYEVLNEGDKIVQGLSKAQRASNFLKAHVPIGEEAKNPYTWLFFALKPKTLITGLGAKKLAEFAHRLTMSPALRRHYGRTIRYALEGNAKGAAKELSSFDREANKEFPEMEQGDFELIKN